MIFSSLLFLFGFLPLFLLSYWAVPRVFRNAVLLVFSLAFYAWGEPRFIFVVLLSALLDWWLARILWSASNQAFRRGLVILAVMENVGLLVYFKYFDFFIANLNAVDERFGLTGWQLPAIGLPLAISFIVFEKITYIVDIYRRVTVPAESLFLYLLYVYFFPKMMAGPIIKYHDIDGQLKKRTESFEDLHEGLLRVVQGLAKKVLIANTLGTVVDPIFATSPGNLTAGLAWLGALAFGFQLYFDFSGYSDIAIGLARIMGIRLMENFNQPYLAASFTEFWQRWHISLTQWIREYLYIPLGGNRRGQFRMFFNLWLCFVLSGLWHGANWTFVGWGIFHGAMLTWERIIGLKILAMLPRAVAVASTFLLITLGWVLFRSPTIGQGFDYLRAMASPGRPSQFVVDLDPHALFIFICAAIISFFDVVQPLAEARKRLQTWPLYSYGQTALWMTLFILAVGNMAATGIKTFIYFRF